MLKEKISSLKKIENAKESNALVRKIIENSTDEIKIELLAEFKEYIDWCKIGDLPDNRIFGIQMLTIFRELAMKEAFDLIIEYLQLNYKIIDVELDDFLLEIVYEILCILGDDRVYEIKRIIKDKTINNYVRATFSSALAFLTYLEKTEIEVTKEFYKEIFEDKNEDLELKFYMTDDLEKLGLKEFKDLIKKVEAQYENLLPWEIEDPVFDSSHFEELKNSKESLLDYLDFYETLDSSNIYDWDEDDEKLFNALPDLHLFDEYDFDYQEPRTSIKIGRNDLCPCGSGKKYKKCCGK
jgi:hypothetical protein